MSWLSSSTSREEHAPRHRHTQLTARPITPLPIDHGPFSEFPADQYSMLRNSSQNVHLRVIDAFSTRAFTIKKKIKIIPKLVKWPPRVDFETLFT